MHYYKFNIGNYRRRTSHLSPLEHGIYRMLLDTYYLEEKPLTSDLAKLMRTHSIRTDDERIAFGNVIEDFFVVTEEGFINESCDVEILKYHEKSDKAKASAEARWSKPVKGMIKKKPAKRFVQPTAQDVAQFSIKESLGLAGFYDYYNSNGWKVGKNKMVDWKAAARGWSKRQKPSGNGGLDFDSRGYA